MAMDERVDLAELTFPGGPVSSRRKNDRVGRGWKKIELWIEQEDPEEIILDDDDEDNNSVVPESGGSKQVTVKVEDDVMGEVELPAAEPMFIESDEDHEELMRFAEKSRARRRRKAFKGKSREEKEEMAREEVDLEVLKDQFLNGDASEVCLVAILLILRGRRSYC